jgi:hypothetical protein
MAAVIQTTRRVVDALRDLVIWQLLRRLNARDPFWTPPGSDWRLRRLAGTYRIKRDRATRALIDEFIAEVDELIREDQARHNLSIDFDPRYRVVVQK